MRMWVCLSTKPSKTLFLHPLVLNHWFLEVIYEEIILDALKNSGSQNAS